MSDSAPPPAGWYADPENPAGERWWNGSGWSDHKRASTVADAAAATGTGSGAFVPPVPSPTSAGFAYGATAATPVDAARPDPYAAASPYAASPYSPAPYGAPAYGSSANGLAIAGLIVSAAGWLVLGVLASIAGIILSAFGLRQARQREAAGNPNSGRSIAMAGLIVGIVVTVLGVLFFAIYLGFIFSIINQANYY
jgi:Protein of unknown function (DUF2510).